MMGLAKQSILRKVLAPMLVVAVTQAVVFYCLLLLSGTSGNLNESSAAIFDNKVVTRAESLVNDMHTNWGRMENFEAVFREDFDSFLRKKSISYYEFDESTNFQKEFLLEITPDLIQLLRQNKVNGVFFIMNGNDGYARPDDGEVKTKQGICIRDLDQNSGYLGNNDLFLGRAPASILEKLSIPLDSNWQAAFEFNSKTENNYYYMPLEAAIAGSEERWSDLGYWDTLHSISQKDVKVISYSIPLRDNSGHIVGVAGIEITENYMNKKLPATELDTSNKGQYMLAKADPDTDGYKIIMKYGYSYNLEFKNNLLFLNNKKINNINNLQNIANDRNIFASIHAMNLYGSSTGFNSEDWYLIGFLNKGDLFDFSTDIKNLLFTTILISLAIAAVGSVYLSRRFVLPIYNLSEHINKTRPEEKLCLPKTNIDEIDQLVTAIEQLQINVLENQRKWGMIIKMAGLPISAFEIDLKNRTVFFTEEFFNILNYKVSQEEIEELREFDKFAYKLRNQEEEAAISTQVDGNQSITTFYFINTDRKEKWVKAQSADVGEKIIGIITDVSKEFQEKVKLEHERDHDLLTNLYNRRAFNTKMKVLFESPQQIGVAAMIMVDLDYLKYINDSYGHDCGDRYIKAAANALEDCIDERMYVARMSGDEFYVFLYKYNNKEEIRSKIKMMHDYTRQQKFHAAREEMFIRMTGGVAWYQEDSGDYLELVRMADFAMYQAKRSAKGEYREFDKEEYARESFMLKNRGELNTILEKEMIEYHFQPIVNLIDGSVFAYEALMRPLGKVIRRPDDMLALAKTQGRLYHIERLTWKKALEEVSSCKELLESDCQLFINSISNQVLSNADIDYIEHTFSDLLGRVVLELTEDERLDNEFTQSKIACLKRWNGKLALDDFGSGYNGENLLLDLNPDYIKVDMKIIRDIDKDARRQDLFNNLISYARSHNILVIAEGVETQEELSYVRKNGAHFVQGYLTGKPRRYPEPMSDEIKELLTIKE